MTVGEHVVDFRFITLHEHGDLEGIEAAQKHLVDGLLARLEFGVALHLKLGLFPIASNVVINHVALIPA